MSTFLLQVHQAHGDKKGICNEEEDKDNRNHDDDDNGDHDDNDDKKVTICHISSGNPSNTHEICVSVNEVPEHLAHGDFIGSCNPSSIIDSADIQIQSSQIQLTIFPNPLSGMENPEPLNRLIPGIIEHLHCSNNIDDSC